MHVFECYNYIIILAELIANWVWVICFKVLTMHTIVSNLILWINFINANGRINTIQGYKSYPVQLGIN